MSNADHPQSKPPIDAPIRSSDADELGRSPVAHDFAQSIRELDTSEGLVVGVLGPWGHGKSSFINLMREEFEASPTLTVVDFNPWMFSGSNQLVNFFFTEIGAELNVDNQSRFGKTADWFAKYAGVLKPVSQIIPVPGAALAGDALVATIQGVADTTNAARSATKIRQKITEELRSLKQPIVIVIDDIDRLTTTEIREIFKLVRLTASFPNLIYILAFDRERVEQALTEDGIPGRAYLEKIVQLSFDVPQAPVKLLRAQVTKELTRILASSAETSPDESRWSDVYFAIIDPLLTNMRDVTRYAISSRATIRSLGKEIDLVDLLAMEAIRVFRPELSAHLSKIRAQLTSTTTALMQKDNSTQEAVDTLLDAFPKDDALIRALINHLFLASRQYVGGSRYGSDWLGAWQTAHRMAHVDFLSLYFDRVAPDGLVAFRGSEQAFRLLSDASGLKEYFTQVDASTIDSLIEGLTSYQSQYTPDMIVPGATTLLNLIDFIPENPEPDFFDFNRPDLTVGRVVIRLLQQIPNENDRERLVTSILAKVETYSSQLHLIRLVGHIEDFGFRLVSKSYAEQLESDLAARIQQSPPKNPSREWDAWRIYDVVKGTTDKAPLAAGTDVVLMQAVLRSVKSTSRSQVSGSRHVSSEDHLAWSLLIRVFGSEDEVRKAVGKIRSELGEDNLLLLADKYLSGWRPKQLGD